MNAVYSLTNKQLNVNTFKGDFEVECTLAEQITVKAPASGYHVKVQYNHTSGDYDVTLHHNEASLAAESIGRCTLAIIN